MSSLAVTAFPTIAEMEGHTRALAGSDVEVRALGTSRSGRTIELISLGHGPLSALVVGAPHPNEPVGCATIELLIDRLIRDPDLRAQLGYRWHFIKAIDVDGIAMNQGWFKGPRTFASYLRHFFRPAFLRQPEYAFPLRTQAYAFEAATPENECWQRALDLSRPHLQASLHNSDYGGAFFLTTDAIPSLTSDLTDAVARTGLGLNTVGDVGYWEPAFAPAFFPLSSLDEPGKLPPDWSAGNSSAGFARQRYGTFSLMPEVPSFTSRLLFDESPSSYTSNDLAASARRLNAEIASTLSRDLPLLTRRALSGDALELQLALEQAERAARSASQTAKEEGAPSSPLSFRDYAMRGIKMRMVLARPYAMLRRLAQLLADEDEPAARPIARSAEERISSELAIIARETAFEAVPTGVLAGLQLDAVLSSAKAVAARR